MLDYKCTLCGLICKCLGLCFPFMHHWYYYDRSRQGLEWWTGTQNSFPAKASHEEMAQHSRTVAISEASPCSHWLWVTTSHQQHTRTERAGSYICVHKLHVASPVINHWANKRRLLIIVHSMRKNCCLDNVGMCMQLSVESLPCTANSIVYYMYIRCGVLCIDSCIIHCATIINPSGHSSGGVSNQQGLLWYCCSLSQSHFIIWTASWTAGSLPAGRRAQTDRWVWF